MKGRFVEEDEEIEEERGSEVRGEGERARGEKRRSERGLLRSCALQYAPHDTSRHS